MGVADSQRTAEYPLNLRGASCPTLARWPLFMGEQEHHTRPPLNGFTTRCGHFDQKYFFVAGHFWPKIEMDFVA